MKRFGASKKSHDAEVGKNLMIRLVLDPSVHPIKCRVQMGDQFDVSGVAPLHASKARMLPALDPHGSEPDIPAYLTKHYWWAYIHPRGVSVFEREWLVNAILWGNYARLCSAVISELGVARSSQVLQVACAYGDFSLRLSGEVTERGGALGVVDVLPVQLANLRQKLPVGSSVRLLLMNSVDLKIQSASYDLAILFFLLHEQPDDVRLETLRETFRVVRHGGKIVIVDYASPAWWNPLRYLLAPLLATFEPFALAVWRRDLRTWMPCLGHAQPFQRRTYFGGVYQKVVIEV